MLRMKIIWAPRETGWKRMDGSYDIFFSELNSLKLARVWRGFSVRWSLRMASAQRLVSLDVIISWAVPRSSDTDGCSDVAVFDLGHDCCSKTLVGTRFLVVRLAVCCS